MSWLRFEGITEYGRREIIIPSDELGVMNKVAIGNQTLFQVSWTQGRFTYWTAIDDPQTASKLAQAGAKSGETITDYPSPTSQNRCIYKALEAIEVTPDMEHVPFNALSLIEDNKFFLRDVEYVREYVNRYGVLSYEVVGSKAVGGEEVPVSSSCSKGVYETLKRLKVPTEMDYDTTDKFVFEGILDMTGEKGAVVIDPKQITTLDRVVVGNYSPVFRVSWVYESRDGFDSREFAVVDKEVGMQIATRFSPTLQKFQYFPFNTAGDRCVMNALPVAPISDSNERWDVIEQANGTRCFFGDIKDITRYRLSNGIVATGIRLERNYQGMQGSAGYVLPFDTFHALKSAGVEFLDRLESQLKDLDVPESDSTIAIA